MKQWKAFNTLSYMNDLNPHCSALMPNNHSQNIHYIQSQPQKIQKDIKKREKECIHIRSMMHTDQGR